MKNFLFSKVLIRLDDFSPNRDISKWNLLLEYLDGMRVSAIIAVIPRDVYFGARDSDGEYWDDVRQLQASGHSIAIHGLTHDVKTIRKFSTIIPFATKSEYVNLSLLDTKKSISNSIEIFKREGVTCSTFIAPNHGYTINLIESLKNFSSIKFISDGVSFRATERFGKIWIPQVDWTMPRFLFGTRTICLHPNSMSQEEIVKIALWIKEHNTLIVKLNDFSDDLEKYDKYSIIDIIYCNLYMIYVNFKELVSKSIKLLK